MLFGPVDIPSRTKAFNAAALSRPRLDADRIFVSVLRDREGRARVGGKCEDPQNRRDWPVVLGIRHAHPRHVAAMDFPHLSPIPWRREEARSELH